MASSTLTLSTHSEAGIPVVRVNGDFDLSTVASFDSEVEQSLSGDHLVIELADCTFIDSSALRALVRAQKRIAQGGGSLAIVAPSQPARRVLEVASLDRFVPVFGTLAEALTSFG